MDNNTLVRLQVRTAQHFLDNIEVQQVAAKELPVTVAMLFWRWLSALIQVAR